MPERIIELDFIKGIAILLVICGHFILGNWYDALDNHPVYTWIYSFHMPLFFFISGYLISNTGRALSKKSIMRKTRALLIPYLVWVFIISPLVTKDISSVSFDLLLNSDAKYWFVYLLWFYSVIYYCYESACRQKSMGGAASIILFIGFLVVVENNYPCQLLSRSIQFLPLYIYGVIAHKFALINKRWVENPFLLSFIFITFWIASLSYCQMGMPLISKVLKLVASFCICTIVLYIIKSKVISGSDINNPFVGFVVYAGKNTIVIYLTHFFFVEMLKVPSVELNNLTPIWVLMISLCASIAIAAVCLLIGKVVEHFEWVNKLVYGRW